MPASSYSSNVLVLEYSFNSTSGRKFQFPVVVFLQINQQLCRIPSVQFHLSLKFP